jgi:hypothetical protein
MVMLRWSSLPPLTVSSEHSSLFLSKADEQRYETHGQDIRHCTLAIIVLCDSDADN